MLQTAAVSPACLCQFLFGRFQKRNEQMNTYKMFTHSLGKDEK